MIESPRGAAPGLAVVDAPRVGPAVRRGPAGVVVAGLIACLAATFPPAARAQEPIHADTIHVDTLATTPAENPLPSPTTTSIPAVAPIGAGGDQASPPSNTLPFASNRIPTTYPSLAVALGFGTYQSNFRGFTEAFRVIADSSAATPVPPPAAVESQSMMLLTFDVSVNRVLDLSIQVGRTLDQDNEVRLIGGLVSGRYTFPGADNVSVLGGFGGGAYGFSIERTYSGGLYVRLEGGGGYGTIAGGLAIRASPHTMFEGSVQYCGMNDVSTNTASAGVISVNVSGVILSLSAMFSF